MTEQETIEEIKLILKGVTQKTGIELRYQKWPGPRCHGIERPFGEAFGERVWTRTVTEGHCTVDELRKEAVAWWNLACEVENKNYWDGVQSGEETYKKSMKAI